MARVLALRALAVLVAGIAVLLPGALAPPALASVGQEAMLQEDAMLRANPAATLDRLRLLGVDRVRMFVTWRAIAPDPTSRQRPPGFVAGDPASYPASSWAILDQIVRDAASRSIDLNFDLGGGAPLWATGAGAPAPEAIRTQWKPSAHEFGEFVRAVATRYSGNYDPATNTTSPEDPNDLPPVDFWSIWNEPNYGPSLAPQGNNGSTLEIAPRMYRDLLDAAWSALQATGHGFDTILFGELAPRGSNDFGIFSGTKPLRFLRALYCVDSSYRTLRGGAATARGCPTTVAGRRAFADAHPALFDASGFSDHPYSQGSPPNVEAKPDPDFSSLAELARLERALDRVQRVYGSNSRLPIYLTEYGYITSPPKRITLPHRYVSPTTAAYYLNWADYLTWRDPRVMTLGQYQLADPFAPTVLNDYGGYASGLLFSDGRHKPSYDAYRLPLYLPITSTHSPRRHLEIWGGARPAGFAFDDTGHVQTVAIQFQPGSKGPFETLQTVSITTANGYFDVRQAFPVSGSVRLSWTYPFGFTVHSRTVSVRVL